METTRLQAPEQPSAARPTSDGSVLPGDVAAFGESLRKEHQRFLSALGDATARLGGDACELAGTAAVHHQLTRQFFDAQRSILLHHAETHAEIRRIEHAAALDASAQLAAARRRAAAIEAHPAGGVRAALQPMAAPSESSFVAPAAEPDAMAEIVDRVFQHREPEGEAARRQLTNLLDGWWMAEQQEARAKIDDAHARAAMRRHVAGVEAAAVAASGETTLTALARCSAPGPALPRCISGILDSATAGRLDDVLSELLASLEAPVQPVPPPDTPLADGAIIRFEPSTVITSNGSDEAFQRFWAREPVAPPARRARWWQHVAVIVPATAVSSLVVAAIAWVG